MAKLTFHSIPVATGTDDREGLLALLDGEFVALFTRMDADFHEEHRGSWHHEFGFSRYDGMPGRFATLADVERWFADRLHAAGGALSEPVEIGRAISAIIR